VEHTTPAEIKPGPSQPDEPAQASVWQELQRACHALAGARGPRRRVAKQELLAALERRERMSVGGRRGAAG
jgi:hypothetical protein